MQQNNATPEGRITLFDTLHLLPGDQPLEIRSEKIKGILAYLILHREEQVDRVKLGQYFWPRASEARVRRYLREYLYRIRRLLDDFWPGVEALTSDENVIHFHPPASCRIDVVEFEKLTQEAESTPTPAQAIPLLQQAIALYRGDLLASLYDDWVSSERDRLRTLFLQNLERLSAAQEATGRPADAIATTRKILEHEPLQEEAHRRLMRLYYATGDRARALQQYKECRQLLSEELAARPLPETRTLYQAIRRGTYQPDAPPATHPAFSEARRPLATTPFAGRQAELARLAEAFAQSRQPAGAAHSNTLIVTGDSGLGKTRLVHEWLATLASNTVILQGRGYEFEQAIPYRPLLDALQQSLHLIPWEALPPDTSYAWLAPLAQLLPDLYYYLPDLSPATAVIESENSHAVMEGMTQLLAAFARRLPVVLFLDDLHWADSATLRFLRSLAQRTRQVPLFIVCTFSPAEATADQNRWLKTLQRTGAAQTLPLSRLQTADFTQLLSHMLDQPVAEIEPLAAHLHHLCGGNPFLATETARTLLESNLSPPYTPEHLAQLTLPKPIRALIENRLDRLCTGSCLLLSMAAAVGREFSFTLLAALAQIDEDELLDYLDDWLARGLVEERQGTYDFSHPQVREVAYGRLSPPRRRRTHFRIAIALETEEHKDIERIAFHYRQSHHPIKAVPALLAAGERALHGRSYGEAHPIGQMLLDILQKEPAAPPLKERVARHLQLALAHSFAGKTEAALQVLQETAPLASVLENHDQSAEIALRMAQLYWVRGEAPEAQRHAQRAWELVPLTPDAGREAAVLRMLGRVAVAQGHLETAVDYLAKSLQTYASQLNRVTVKGYMAPALAALGRHEAASATLEETLQLAQHLDHPALTAVIRAQAATAYSLLEMWPQASAIATQAFNDCQTLNLPVYAFLARAALGRACYHQGSNEEGQRLLHETIEWAEANDYFLFRFIPHLHLATMALVQCDEKTFCQQENTLQKLAHRTGNRWPLITIERYRQNLH